MRIDAVSRVIPAPPEAVYRAFSEPGALERWLAPNDMTGTMLRFDFREGGSYRMRLTYKELGAGRGKTSEDADEFEVRLIRLKAAESIEQEIRFESDDPAFSGVMHMTSTFAPQGEATLVTVRAENVPAGISPEDHEVGLISSVDNLVTFVQEQRR